MDSRKDSLNNVEITLIDANQKQQEPLLKLQEDRKIKDLREFLDSRKPTAFEIVSISSTERLQAWLGKKGSLDTLFTVLGLHKAMDRAANSLLIRMNLERWNFVMKYLDNTGHYNFQDTLKETLIAFCGNEKWSTLFLERLVSPRDTPKIRQLKWLHEMRKPEDIYVKMKVKEEDLFTGSNLAKKWITYLVAYNDLYPQSRTTLGDVVPQFEERWLKTTIPILKKYPSQGIQRQIVGEILKSWAYAKPPLSPADVFELFKIPGSSELATMRLKALNEYLKLFKCGMQPDKQFAVEKLEKSINTIYNIKDSRSDLDPIKRFADRLYALGPNTLSKRKPESPPENARDRLRPRGE
ncbi:unnamed protein product [Peronospora farinosa]|uniref:Uncharacterized protein n=1 Tax=Peronospora farinosa TaxID=134698 RepID=A0ABN8C9H8_9STRA|nr:unnamed protein product [Peronospora farinosa]